MDGQDIKSLKKLSTFLKESAAVIGIILALSASWFRLTESVTANEKALADVHADIAVLEEQVKDNAERINEHTTSIKVIETQLNLIGGKQ